MSASVNRRRFPMVIQRISPAFMRRESVLTLMPSSSEASRCEYSSRRGRPERLLPPSAGIDIAHADGKTDGGDLGVCFPGAGAVQALPQLAKRALRWRGAGYPAGAAGAIIPIRHMKCG